MKTGVGQSHIWSIIIKWKENILTIKQRASSSEILDHNSQTRLRSQFNSCQFLLAGHFLQDKVFTSSDVWMLLAIGAELTLATTPLALPWTPRVC